MTLTGEAITKLLKIIALIWRCATESVAEMIFALQQHHCQSHN
jgi:hypothetical protein